MFIGLFEVYLNKVRNYLNSFNRSSLITQFVTDFQPERKDVQIVHNDVQATHAHRLCSNLKPQSVTWILLVTITLMTLFWQHIYQVLHKQKQLSKTDVYVHVIFLT